MCANKSVDDLIPIFIDCLSLEEAQRVSKDLAKENCVAEGMFGS